MGDPLLALKEQAQTSDILDPTDNARSIIRLIQCTLCGLPLRTPITLPCGYSLCRPCMPAPHARANISYPVAMERQQGIHCPFPQCSMEHSLSDCNVDVALTNILENIGTEIRRSRMAYPDTPVFLQEMVPPSTLVQQSTEETSPSEKGRFTTQNGGRLLAMYTMAELGLIQYNATISYGESLHEPYHYHHLDIEVMEKLNRSVKGELDCHVCYHLLLDPVTTPCGHSFCRRCLARTLDHSTSCPMCRRTLEMRSGLHREPANHRVFMLMLSLFPTVVAERAETVLAESGGRAGTRNVPLFVCTLAYPTMPTFLHIFEPRYRLMIRRAVESGDRKFGMLMYNESRASQGSLGRTQFMEYGTLLHIQAVQTLPDGRSLIETRGEWRFRVESYGMLDGYLTGNVERVNDVSLSEEEQLESIETSRNLPPSNCNLQSLIDSMSTQDLLQIGTEFITQMRAASAPWLHERVLASYGLPPDDPAIFPYWFASILPMAEAEKYKLLPTQSVRERLKITAMWVRRIQASRW